MSSEIASLGISDSLLCTGNNLNTCLNGSWMECRNYILRFSQFDVFSLISTAEYNPVVWSIFGSIIVGLSGIFPLLIIPIDEGVNLQKGAGAKTLKVLLSFAVGGLLGDVFLHLLPEAWNNHSQSVGNSHPSMYCGLWVLTGLLTFVILEKMLTNSSDQAEIGELKDKKEIREEGETPLNNNSKEYTVEEVKHKQPKHDGSMQMNSQPGQIKGKVNSKQMSGYLNLAANSIDNFMHGLAVGGSFVLSLRIGILSTSAILVHEIPHEVGDFAILLRAGWSRWGAAQAQIMTAAAGVLGALTALIFSPSTNSVEARTSWVLPFTAGGFLHIALVTVLPELLQEKSPRESLKQFLSLILGIAIMALLTAVLEG